MLINLDYDGVVVDSFEILYQQSLKAQALTGYGRPPAHEDIRTLQNMTFQDLGHQCQIPASQIPVFVNHVFDLQRQSTVLPPAFPGMVDQLKALAREHTLTIITSSSKTTVEQALERDDLTSAISLILDGTGSKPKSERIKIAQTTFNVSARHTYMIGDSMSDIRQGKLAGVRTVAVTWGFQPRELLLNEAPDCVIDAPEELHASLFQDFCQY